ncbi:hypothetical protein AC578_9449 [Pseudocercospora eumusae]|uniref:Uncharacterized protein n=1 Tax=Pseudocercospora eumusae TaxID=321146 RepID=A0A139GYI4_9PEZI|nr:hypothetical protein AC578_9449 [Pseudocercospora eumusae]
MRASLALFNSQDLQLQATAACLAALERDRACHGPDHDTPFDLAHAAFAPPFVITLSPYPNNRSHYRRHGYRRNVR